jgi:hypothetical protein
MVSEFCAARTQGEPPWYRGSPCGRKAVRDGFCNIHHPEKVKARREKAAAEAKARWDAKQARSPWAVANRYREALRKIADGHNDPRTLAKETLRDSDGSGEAGQTA